MQKRLIAICLTIILLLSQMSPALAMAISSVVISSGGESNTNIQSLAVIGSQLYILGNNGKITTRSIADPQEMELGEVSSYYGVLEEDTENPVANVQELFAADGKLYGFSISSGVIYQLLDDAGEFAPKKQDVKLDTSAFSFPDGEYNNYLQLKGVFAQDGWLYYTGTHYSDIQENKAGRISLTTGEHQAFVTPAIKELVSYKNGQILALIYDDSAMYASSGTAFETLAQIAVFDPQGDKIISQVPVETESSMGGYNTTGLVYGDDKLYVRDSSRIKGFDLSTGTAHISAYTGDSTYGGMNARALYLDGYYVYYGYEGLFLLKLDSESLKDGVLTIYGEYGSETHKTFIKNHPDISVDITTNTTSDLDTLTQAMVSESQTLDVLELNPAYMPVDKLVQKGYCLDLSGYPEITSRIESMYPQFRDAMLVDGKLYGVPVAMNATTFGVNMEKWEELGLGEEDLPTSLLELFDFVANWVYDYGDEHSDLTLFEFEQVDELLFQCILQQYMTYMQYKGESLRFDTPEFRKLVEAYEQIDFGDFSDGSQDANTMYYYNQESLFSLFHTVGTFYGSMAFSSFQTIPLSLLGEDEPLISASLTMMTINPKSKRIDQAILYLTNYLDNLDKRTAHISLFPDHNEPIESSYYQQAREDWLKTIEEYQKYLEAASEENKATLEDNIKEFENYLVELENNRYDASAEDIAAYRENIAPLLFVQEGNLLYSGDSNATTEIVTLLQKYMDGAISVDQLVKDFDARLRLMELEDQ